MSITTEISLAARSFLSPKEVASLVPGMTVAKLAQLRFKGEGPRYYKPTPKTVIYSEADCLEWLESTVRTGTAEVA